MLKLPKISLKWILPILLGFILISAIIALTTNQNDSGSGRPSYLVTNEELPETWEVGLEQTIEGRYFVQITTDVTKAFAIETEVFSSQIEGNQFVDKQYLATQTSGLEYRFYENKMDLEIVDNGYVWEIKSPCCYSRGVTFSFDGIYIYIFGSQESLWEDIEVLYGEQLSNIYEYLGKEIPDTIKYSSTQSSSLYLRFMIVPILGTLIGVRFLRRQLQR